MEMAEACGGLLASVFDDLNEASKLRASDIERTKRLVRVMAATQEPAASALRIAMACSPINGEACVRHWDVLCEKAERGKLAWLLGMHTEAGERYGKRQARLDA